MFHIMCRVRKLKTLSQNQKHYRNDATCRITKTRWKSIKCLWFQIVFLGYILLQQQIKLCFNLTCLAVSNNRLEFRVMWTSLLRYLHNMSFKIIQPLKQVQVRHIFLFDFMCSQKVNCKANSKQSATSPTPGLHRHADWYVSMQTGCAYYFLSHPK